jgi:hypothetical protein
MIKFVEHRIGDGRIVRLIQKWLKAGVMEQGRRFETEEGGEADKAANLAGWKSPCRQLPVFRRQAYPMHAEVTKHVLLGSKSLSCPAAVCAAVGTIREASELGGLNIKECLQP